MWGALRSQALSLSSSSQQWRKLGFLELSRMLSSTASEAMAEASNNNTKSLNYRSSKGLLELEEVEKILNDVKAADVTVIPIQKQQGFDFADFMVVATGRGPWHVRNIAQALIYKVKQKQKGAKRMLLPSVEGQEEGKWVVIDSGSLIIHALDEKARAYYNLERLWSSDIAEKEHTQDLEKAFVKIRPKNNSKRRPVRRSS